MTSVMYKMKNHHASAESSGKIELPNVMYKMKNFHESNTTPATVDTSSLDPAASLGLRQEAILTKLVGLRQVLDVLKGRYQVSETPVTQKTGGQASARQTTNSSAAIAPSPLGSVIHDIVINADPASPPLSLFVLFELLKEKFTVLATSYTHSSVTDVNPHLCSVIKNGCQVTRGNHQLALSVVLKKVENGPELLVSPSRQSVIVGEVNIARYINRILNPTFDTADITFSTTVDEWLDTADVHLLHGNSKQKNATVKSLNVRLKKNAWIVGDQFSLVDAVIFSALHQQQLASDATEVVQKWLKRCRELKCFSSALKVLS